MDKDSGSGGGVGLSHDVFDVLFNGLLRDLKCVCNLFICPAFSKVFHNRLFAVCERELFLGLIRIELLPAGQFLQGDDESGKLHTAPVRQAESSQKHRLLWITSDALDLKLFPILRFRSYVKGFDNFSAQLGQC